MTEFKQPKEPKSTIISFVPFQISEEKPGLLPGRFVIPPGSEEKPAIYTVEAARHYVYLDGDRGSLPVRDASYEVARSLCEDFSTAQLGRSEDTFPGIFWVPGELTWEEIQKQFPDLVLQNRIAHKRWLLKLTQIADDDFNKHKQHNVVSDFQRRAAEILKLPHAQHPWMNVNNTLESSTCPACGTLYRPGLVICANCACVLDKVKFKELEFAGTK